MVMSPNNKIMSLNSSVYYDLSLWWGHLCVMGSMLTFEWKIGSQWSKHSLFPSAPFFGKKKASYIVCLPRYIEWCQ